MVEAKAIIVNESGIHARPASELVEYLKGFENANVSFIKDERAVNAKSILHLLTLGLKKGAEVLIRVEGENEQETLDKILAFIAELKG